mmetsp:Transcript_21764/g.44692  ORF Transcript_21764/g.44692 Transcript_21764/m.44692 type:complete len:506 (+) Transcript_21764:47-1564(+)
MDRPYDIIVFGATGYTGKHVAKTLWSLTTKKGDKCGSWSGIRWAIAGRSKLKLDKLIAEMQAITSGSVPVILADVEDGFSMRAMAAKSRILMNCTGPYRFYGAAVVDACIVAGCDYVDLCGEPEFMDRTALLCHARAQSSGVLIVHGCAFDSVPADCGTLFACLQFPPPGKCAHVRMYHTWGATTTTTGASAHATTFYAAVHGFGAVAATRRQRAELLESLERHQPGSSKGPGPLPGCPKLKVKAGPEWEPLLQQYAFLFPGADAAVVRSTQRRLAHRKPRDERRGSGGGRGQEAAEPSYYFTPQFGAYFCVSSFGWAVVVAAIGAVFSTLAKWGWGRRLLLAHPRFFTLGFFSDEGPSQATLDAGYWRTHFVASGWSGKAAAAAAAGEQASSGTAGHPPAVVPFDREVVCSVRGPEAGYVATSLLFAAMAQTLLEDRPALVKGVNSDTQKREGEEASGVGGGGGGGVFTPGALIGGAGPDAVRWLAKRCSALGVEFTVDEEKSI